MKRNYIKRDINKNIFHDEWWQIRTVWSKSDKLKIYVGGHSQSYQDLVNYGSNAIIFGFEI